MATANEVLEEAKGFKRLIDEGLSKREVAKKTGRGYQYVLMSLTLLDAPEEVHKAIPKIGPSKAKTIAYHYHKEPELQKLLVRLAREGEEEEGERDEHRPKRDLVNAALSAERPSRIYGKGKPAKEKAKAILREMRKGKTLEQATAIHEKRENRKRPTKKERRGNRRKARLKSPPTTPKRGSPRGNSGGEGEEHRQLKQYVKDNPSCLPTKIQQRGLVSETEKKLPSGDSMDVSFENEDCWIGVEVKPRISDVNDIERGLYQCVKYQAVMKKFLAVRGLRKNVKVFLVLGCPFPRPLLRVKSILGVGVKVIENIGVHDSKDGMPPLPED